MKRLLVLAALAVAGATAGCDLSPGAAKVGDATISRSQLDAQLAAVSGSTYTSCALQLQGVNLPSPLTGSGDATVSSSAASFVLSTMVLERLVDQDLTRRHQPATVADLRAASTDFATQLTSSSGSSCGLQGQKLVARLPKAFVDQQVRFLAAQERLAEAVGHVDVSTAALERYYQSHASQFQELCLSDIAVTAQAQAQQIHDAISSGATTFEAAARQSSIDNQTAPNGGKIACVPSSQVLNSVILGAIAGLQPGQLSQPTFEPQTGTSGTGVWFLLRLDGRPQVPFAQAQSQIREQLLSAQNGAVSAEFNRLIRRAPVTVDPRYGKWSPSQGVLPPATPKPSYLLTPPAGGGSALGLGTGG